MTEESGEGLGVRASCLTGCGQDLASPSSHFSQDEQTTQVERKRAVPFSLPRPLQILQQLLLPPPPSEACGQVLGLLGLLGLLMYSVSQVKSFLFSSSLLLPLRPVAKEVIGNINGRKRD